MAKRILCALFCGVLILSMFFPVFAEPQQEEALPEEQEEPVVTTMYINTQEGFLRFAQDCMLDSFSQNLQVELQTDIDLTGVDFAGIPIFCGTFHGNGHTITGMKITADGSALGLFRYLSSTARVEDLNLEGSVLPQGSQSILGGFAGENHGTIQNCNFRGEVSGNQKVGGIAGINGVSGIIDNCRTLGSVNGSHFIGGMVGENTGVIRKSINNAHVNTTPQQNSVEVSDITMDSLTGSESAATVTDVGGIAGTSGGVIRNCDNSAPVGYRQMGYNVGGIAGSQMGYINGCKNFADISGRKEVGGIVGQMEPVTKITYTTDTLQQLEQQLDAMGAVASRVSANAQSSASAVTGSIAALQEDANTAKDAVDILLNDGAPDGDSLQAAENALNSSFSSMQSNMQSISTTTQTAAAALSNDMQALMGQISAMGATLKAAPENLGGSVADISDQDTPEDTTGKVSDCINYGAVLADMNAGGIAGSIAPENDLDPEEDVEVTGETSLNFDSELRAVILNCENAGQVSAGKQCSGGIAGRMALGLVKGCLNTGSIRCEGGDYTGGIAGKSIGYLRNCYANCIVSGGAWVGGIAGQCEIVTDCRTMVQLAGTEKIGAILGYTDSRDEIAGNYYMTLEADPGAIDGISYQDVAQSLQPETFQKLKDLPPVFHRNTVTFVFADGSEQKVQLSPGQPLDESKIPPIPQLEGHTSHWADLDSMQILFDRSFTAQYEPYVSVMASQETGQDSKPLLLTEGSFLPDTQIQLTQNAQGPDLGGRYRVVTAMEVSLPQSIRPITLHCLIPADSQATLAYVRLADGSWQQVNATASGSYLLFEAPQDATAVALAIQVEIPWMWIFAGFAVCAAAALLILKKRRKA